MATTPELQAPAFKQAHAKYRRRPDNPTYIEDVHELIDFGAPASSTTTAFRLPDDASGLYKGPMYGLRDFPGFFYAPQALAPDLQRLLAFQAVTLYCEAPHRTNIENIPPKKHEIQNDFSKEDESMWELWKQDVSKASKKMKKSPYYRSFQKLSWATMGYHYNWTERCYTEGDKSPVPTELESIGTLFARTAFHHLSRDRTPTESNFSATACIVNYYSTKSNMGGHRDDLELALDKPVISFSMGRSAVFLLGGATKEETPIVPILVRPGDVMILGGASRLNYHSMPRLLPLEGLPKIDPLACPDDSCQVSSHDIFMSAPQGELSATEEECLDRFLHAHRININLRQVFQSS